jgi:hypothetical protein
MFHGESDHFEREFDLGSFPRYLNQMNMETHQLPNIPLPATLKGRVIFIFHVCKCMRSTWARQRPFYSCRKFQKQTPNYTVTMEVYYVFEVRKHVNG